MKKLRLFGFDNLPEGNAIGTPATCYGLSYHELAPICVTTLSILSPARISANKLVVGKTIGNAAASSGQNVMKISKMIGDAASPNWVVIGFRFKRLAATTGAPNAFVVRGSASAVAADLGVYCPASTLPDDCYVEIVMDFTASKWYRFVDDVQAATGTISGFSRTTISTVAWWGIGQPNASWIPAGAPEDVWMFSDIYAMCDDGNDAPVPLERLGPISVKRLPVLSAVGSGYTTSDGSDMPSVLNTGREGTASLNTPNVVMPAGNTPLHLKFDNSALGVVDVVGVDVKVASTKITDGQNFNVNFSYSGNDTVPVGMTPSPGGTTVNVAGGILTNTLPGGSKLNATNVGDLELVITPTS